MTIRKGEQWGVPIVVPLETRDVDSDRELSGGTTNHIHIVHSGDIYDALGEPSAPQVDQTRTLVCIDALQCSVVTGHGNRNVLAASSVTIGRWRTAPWNHQRFICVTNAGLYQKRNIAPRAHPNDGVFDIVEISSDMPWRERAQSYRRAVAGDHLPHPFISVSRDTTFECSRQYLREVLMIDSQEFKDWQSIQVQILPDYWKVIV